MQSNEKQITGYPSIDKPWLKYYSEEACNAVMPDKTLFQYIYENNKEHKHDIALNYFGRKITYGKLFENIEKVAKSFQKLGVKEGDIVTIMSMHTPEVIYCIYALNRLGAVANMVYMTLSEKEILDNLKRTNSKILVVLSIAIDRIFKVKNELSLDAIIVVSPADSMKLVMGLGYKIKTKQKKMFEYMTFKEFMSLGNKVERVCEVEYNRNTPAIIVYTSGSTGQPKGVMLSNYNLNAVAYQYKISGMEFNRKDTFLNIMPPFVGFGITIGMNLPLALGLEEIVWILPDKNKVAEGFVKYKPKHFVLGPAFLDGIMQKEGIDLSFLITFAGGGEEISIEKENALNKYLASHGANVKYVTGYGMTEFGATVCTGMNHVYKERTLGIPLPAVTVKIVNTETNEELMYTKVGEICINAPNTMLGYFKNAKDTMEIIRVHNDGKTWLHTGDLGMVDEEGFVHYKGRIKRIYLTNGDDEIVYKLFPMRVEEVFMKHPEVDACATVSIPDIKRINVLVSYIILKEGAKNIVPDLEEFARSELPRYSVPVSIFILDKLPTTQSGKVDYKRLEQRAIEACK